ncbi:MAG: PIN domain-containing protein [Gammaproteobacteria bacterium]|nr:PIN domain-containing protein [Gammaproteobacteria bacterium]MXW44999.1 type II toxin-antitoxin system VapC family toxin [Gammaproteobacteria bacterium]MYD01695.1 type II toxin-antitoxin system VapC family toxin [Gammaproteobacteria bacterium]MYI25401.1 type II toxin-antitoxin system VapC family toxin [Gammaproteobacteria bacterium]
MSAVYIDTSVLAGIAFGEPAAERFALALNRFDRLLSSNLLEAEIRAVFQREGERFEDAILAGIDWILPTRPLSAECARALGAGYLRGADLWHVATALYFSPQPESLTFATLDAVQARVASTLGFLKCRI